MVRASIDYVQYLSDPPFVSGPAPGFTGGPPVNGGVPVHAVPMKKGVPIPGGVPLRKLERRSGGRIVAGVAGGIADHLGIDVLKVRVAFAILAAMAGSGIVIYGASGSSPQPARTPRSRPRPSGSGRTA